MADPSSYALGDPPAELTFCLIVPSGRWNLAPLVAAIRAHHAAPTIVAVWCGDPHLRPVLDPALGVRWADTELAEPNGIGWELMLAALRPQVYEWLRTAVVVGRLLDAAARIAVLRVGSVGVLGDCSALVGAAPVTLVPRDVDQLPADGLAPSDIDLLREGCCSTVMAGFGPGAAEALSWLAAKMLVVDGPLGPWLDRMGQLFGAEWCADAGVGAGAWRRTATASPVLLDLEHFDVSEPWHFAIDAKPSRMRLSDSPPLAAAVESACAQIDGGWSPPALPGGVVIDAAIRGAVRSAINATKADDDSLPPSPFGSESSRFLHWLETPAANGAHIGRYWVSLIRTRPDLVSVFPRFDSVDGSAFRRWLATSWLTEQRSVLIGGHDHVGGDIQSVGKDPSGLNVLGYLAYDQSLGHLARQIVRAFLAAGVPCAPLNHERAMLSSRSEGFSGDNQALYRTNLIVVTADQFEFVVADHGESLLAGRRTIAYWFWELEHVPDRFREAIDHVDEIWTGSQFIADAFAQVTDKPVRCVPIPVAEPQPSQRDRASMGLPADAYVFLTTFDQFSVPERKNPFGTIEAFTRAFADGEGPVLLIKTMNGAKGWRNHERLLLAAAGRSDIIVWDEHLSRPDQMAVLAAADCLVSLHRSEGLGLHCAEAMWLGKPVIATAYSGNLDFMDDTVAAMIDYRLIEVRHGEGIYPEDALWADPDLDQAAEWMRRLVADPALGMGLGARARARMQQQPTMAETGRMMAELAGLHPAVASEANTSEGAT